MSSRDENAQTERARARLREATQRLLTRWRGRPTTDLPAQDRPPGRGLVVVDVQNDFINGALSVRGAARIIPILNRYLELFARRELPVYLARDWHSPDGDGTPSALAGVALPLHCVRGTSGAAFPVELQVPVGSIVISKGTQPNEQGHSAFSGHLPGPVSLRESLEARVVRTVYVAGLGSGVSATVFDGCQLGLDMVLLVDAVRGIEDTSTRLRRAIDGMCRAGARIEQIEDVECEIGPVKEAASAASSLP